jgi:hypothetical protein
VAIVGRGLGGRLEVTLSDAGSGEFVFAQVSAGNTAALRAALRRGFQPICAEYLVR